MYHFNPQNHLYGEKVRDQVLRPLMKTGGSTWFCHFTFRNPYMRIKDEDFPKLHITPYLLSLSRQTQSVITPFVGWWSHAEDKRKITHWHLAFHSTEIITTTWEKKFNKFATPMEILWRSNAHEGGRFNKIQPYDITEGGLSYIYGEHQRRDEPYWERPFTPPTNGKSQKLLKPFDTIERLVAIPKRKKKEQLPKPPRFTQRYIRRPKSA